MLTTTRLRLHPLAMVLPLTLVAALCGCRAPSRNVEAGPNDFALIEIQLRG